LGPKKFLRRPHVFDVARRRREAGGAVAWEGNLFAASLKALGRSLAENLPRVLAGDIPDAVLDRDDAEIYRIEQCTGEPL